VKVPSVLNWWRPRELNVTRNYVESWLHRDDLLNAREFRLRHAGADLIITYFAVDFVSASR
jgi:delta-aminolevulinic acid dehydratase/porphobilinogen synthase